MPAFKTPMQHISRGQRRQHQPKHQRSWFFLRGRGKVGTETGCGLFNDDHAGNSSCVVRRLPIGKDELRELIRAELSRLESVTEPPSTWQFFSSSLACLILASGLHIELSHVPTGSRDGAPDCIQGCWRDKQGQDKILLTAPPTALSRPLPFGPQHRRAQFVPCERASIGRRSTPGQTASRRKLDLDNNKHCDPSTLIIDLLLLLPISFDKPKRVARERKERGLLDARFLSKRLGDLIFQLDPFPSAVSNSVFVVWEYYLRPSLSRAFYPSGFAPVLTNLPPHDVIAAKPTGRRPNSLTYPKHQPKSPKTDAKRRRRRCSFFYTFDHLFHPP
ncbi:hypothetical protein LCI18_008900 [Fusarium solani-melongenae]|uniref:Uncharacterized protein n=1 Tax=Fusarium solani subsp. cucurbitae TaxID=2747967 RepID=A0ACD3Z9S7_FUSSC|nr:hypothetical protein LCI18_008900 [Fusarium solani-melongenae]